MTERSATSDACAWATCRKQGHMKHGAYLYCSMHVVMARRTEQEDINDGTAPPESHHGRILAAVAPAAAARDVIDDALEHESPKIRRAAEKADRARDALTALLAEWSRDAKEREAAARELAEAEQEYAKVVARLNKAKKAARVRGRSVSASPADRTVRAKKPATPAQLAAMERARAAKTARRQAAASA